MPEEQWSEPEKWAWEEIRAGRIADFNEHDGHELDPKALDGWHEGRKLRSDFLKEVLFREPYRSAIAVEGMRIVGAWFSDTLDLAHGRVGGQLWLEKCRLDRTANLFGIQVDGSLSLRHCSFKKHGSAAVSVDLGGARITGFVMMQGVTCAGSLRMNGLEVGESLYMRGPNAAFQDVDLGSAKVGSHLDMSGATVAGRLNMNGLRTGSLQMRGPNATYQEVDLGGAKVDGQLAMIGATVAGKLNMDSLTVGQSLLMGGPDANFREDVDLRNAYVGGQLAMVGATLAGTLNMNGLEIRGALLGGPASFRDFALTGTKVGGSLSTVPPLLES